MRTRRADQTVLPAHHDSHSCVRWNKAKDLPGNSQVHAFFIDSREVTTVCLGLRASEIAHQCAISRTKASTKPRFSLSLELCSTNRSTKVKTCCFSYNRRKGGNRECHLGWDQYVIWTLLCTTNRGIYTILQECKLWQWRVFLNIASKIKTSEGISQQQILATDKAVDFPPPELA